MTTYIADNPRHGSSNFIISEFNFVVQCHGNGLATKRPVQFWSASEMTYIVSSGALNSTHSLTLCNSAPSYMGLYTSLKTQLHFIRSTLARKLYRRFLRPLAD